MQNFSRIRPSGAKWRPFLGEKNEFSQHLLLLTKSHYGVHRGPLGPPYTHTKFGDPSFKTEVLT